MHVHYIDSGIFNVAFTDPAQPGFSPASVNSANTNRIGSVTYVDLNAQYEIRNDARGRLVAYAAIDNLGDIEPPFFMNGNPALFSPLGQTFRLGVRFGF